MRKYLFLLVLAAMFSSCQVHEGTDMYHNERYLSMSLDQIIKSSISQTIIEIELYSSETKEYPNEDNSFNINYYYFHDDYNDFSAKVTFIEEGHWKVSNYSGNRGSIQMDVYLVGPKDEYSYEWNIEDYEIDVPLSDKEIELQISDEDGINYISTRNYGINKTSPVYYYPEFLGIEAKFVVDIYKAKALVEKYIYDVQRNRSFLIKQ